MVSPTTVNISHKNDVNNHSYDFSLKEDACSYVMMLAISHHKYAPFEVLKENICNTCQLISELLIIKSEELSDEFKAEKTRLKKKAGQVLRNKDWLLSTTDKNHLLLAWGDQMMAMEGKALLPGFGFGSKKFKEQVKGNPERLSVTKTAW